MNTFDTKPSSPAHTHKVYSNIEYKRRTTQINKFSQSIPFHWPQAHLLCEHWTHSKSINWMQLCLSVSLVWSKSKQKLIFRSLIVKNDFECVCARCSCIHFKYLFIYAVWIRVLHALRISILILLHFGISFSFFVFFFSHFICNEIHFHSVILLMLCECDAATHGKCNLFSLVAERQSKKWTRKQNTYITIYTYKKKKK